MKVASCVYGYLQTGFLVFLVSCGSTRSPHKVSPSKTASQEASDPKTEEEPYTSLAEFPPYFVGVLDGEAAEALAENRLEDAIRLFDEMQHAISDIVLTPRARFIAAFLAEALGDDERAVRELPELAKELPVLSDIARERAARAAIRMGKCDLAIELVALIDKTSSVAADAALIHAHAVRAQGKYREAADGYQRYLDAFPKDTNRQEAESRFVECMADVLAHTEFEEDEAKKALSMLNHLKAQHPASYWTRMAEKHENTILKALGRKPIVHSEERKAAIRAYAKALELKKQMKHNAAEKAYKRVLRLARLDSSLLCRAHFERSVVVASLREYERAADLFEHTYRVCQLPNLRIRALYRGAKAYYSADRVQDAIRLFGLVESEFSDHSFADDARLRGAKCYLDLGDHEKFVEMLLSLPELYPAGDMRAEALWTLAHDALERNEMVRAREALAKYHELFPNETGWYAAGRSAYWLGRAEELMGDLEKAKERYEHVIASAPLSYYMVLAYNRLANLTPKGAESLIAELSPKGGKKSMRFEKSLLKKYQKLSTAIELQRLGLEQLAKREFDRLLMTPHLPMRVNWIVAQMQSQTGDVINAKETATKNNTAWKRRYPAKEDETPWALAYPRAFEDEVTKAAQDNSISSHLIWAIMREESGFNPKVESWANAIGLMQLILPTAKSMGAALGIRVNARKLRQPEINIALGTAYLKYLEEKFGDHPILIVAGYNAGEGAVGRWLQEKGAAKDTDFFIERIPYDQTRGYTKRVISTYATYLFLYGEVRKILELPLTVP